MDYFRSVEQYLKDVENNVQARVNALAKYKKKEARRKKSGSKSRR